jgi:hypothetical protein
MKEFFEEIRRIVMENVTDDISEVEVKYKINGGDVECWKWSRGDELK